MPGQAERFAVLQDDQRIGEENEATSLLVLPDGEIGQRKTRLAAHWLEACGWETELIERRHCGDIAITDDDPPYLLCGLDRVEPRLLLARHGFPYMLDAGIGHGAGDFEGIQLRTVAKGQAINGLWETPEPETESSQQKATRQPRIGNWSGMSAHVANWNLLKQAMVPFVGAATGALAIAQLIGLASLESSPYFYKLSSARRKWRHLAVSRLRRN